MRATLVREDADWPARLLYISQTAYDQILETTSSPSIQYRWALAPCYVLTFACIVFLFMWLGLIEFIQTERKLTDSDLMLNPYRCMSVATFTLDGVEQIVEGRRSPNKFRFEYDPSRRERSPEIQGPLCAEHGEPMHYIGATTRTEREHDWRCFYWKKEGGKTRQDNHIVNLSEDETTIRSRARVKARDVLKDRDQSGT